MDDASNSCYENWDFPAVLEYIITSVSGMSAIEAVAAGMLIAKNMNNKESVIDKIKLFRKITSELKLDNDKKIQLCATSLLEDFNKEIHESVKEGSIEQNISVSQYESRRDSAILTDVNKKSSIKRFK